MSSSTPWTPAEATVTYRSATKTYTVGGQSSQPHRTKVALAAFAPDFSKLLGALKQGEKWGMFSCAETNAVARLIKIRRGKVDLAGIVVSSTTRDGSLILRPCNNCSQWLEETGSGTRTFKIKAEFLPKLATATATFDRESDTDFPKLSAVPEKKDGGKK